MTLPGSSPERPATRRADGAAPSPAARPAVRGLTVAGSQATQFTFTLIPGPDESVMELFGRLSASLKEFDATVLKLMVFGAVRAHAPAVEALRRIFGKPAWPLTWVDGAGCGRQPVAGLQVFAVAGGDVHAVELNGRIVGSVFEDGAMRHCLLGGLGPDNPLLPRADQARQALGNLTASLARAGFSLEDVVRTWFFNDELLAWYREFNEVRTRLYSRTQFRSGSLPASTGVSARNPDHAALTLGAWAVQPSTAAARVQEVASPLQCPAPNYGSSFSRAIEIQSPGARQLLVSGTASITPDGRSIHNGDITAQIDLSMEVVAAILASRQMTWAEVSRATAYFKSAADAPVFARWLARHGQWTLPVVCAVCDICRDDLLFEIELDAVRAEG
jgi:enamine deaminase RidA (YjgF/YER057c/UK114 family)